MNNYKKIDKKTLLQYMIYMMLNKYHDNVIQELKNEKIIHNKNQFNIINKIITNKMKRDIYPDIDNCLSHLNNMK